MIGRGNLCHLNHYDDIDDKTKKLLDQEWEKIIYDEEYDPDRSLDDDGDV